jgi:peptidoglycan/LPS O-acetylase OafA/YrhL
VLITQFLVPSQPKSPFLVGLSMDQFWSSYYFPPARIFEFGLGMFLARLVAAGRWPRIGVVPAAAFMVAGYIGSLYVPILYRFVAITAIPIGVLICATAAADIRGTKTGMGNRVMRWLGERSFGFYMAQGIVLFYGRNLIGDNRQYSTPVAILVIAGFLVANVIAGWLLYVCVERPVMRRWARKKNPVRPALPAGTASVS